MQSPTEALVRLAPPGESSSLWLDVWEEVGEVGGKREGKLHVELSLS